MLGGVDCKGLVAAVAGCWQVAVEPDEEPLKIFIYFFFIFGNFFTNFMSQVFLQSYLTIIEAVK